MLAAFSSKDLEKKPSRRIELFQAIFPTNISSQYARSVPCKKKNKKKKQNKRDRLANQLAKRQRVGPEEEAL